MRLDSVWPFLYFDLIWTDSLVYNRPYVKECDEPLNIFAGFCSLWLREREKNSWRTGGALI